MGGPFLKLVPDTWVASTAAKNLPPDKVTSWFDYYLAGYVWDKPSIQLSHTKVISDALPGASKYFIGDAQISAIIPALVLIVVIYYFYIRKGFLKKRTKATSQPASQRTEVRVVYTARVLYIGVMCFDQEPDKIIAKEMQRAGLVVSRARFLPGRSFTEQQAHSGRKSTAWRMRCFT